MTDLTDPRGLPDHAPDAAAPSQRPILRAAVQIAGFAIGLALLWYCATRALDPKNREHLARLREVTAGQSGALIGLTLLSLVANGSVFWLTIRPVKRLPYGDTLAVNAVATLLALAPFKLSLVFRVVVHKARNGLPILTGGAWMAAVAAPAGASLWRRHAGAGVDGLWWAASIGGIVVDGVVLVLLARYFLSPGGWGWIERLFANIPGKKLHEVLLPRGHESLRMLADPGGVAGGLAVRAGDIAIQTARFIIAAKVIGVALAPGDALIIASVYFLIGAAAPTGAIGFREGGAFFIFRGLLGSDDSFPIIIGLVSAVDIAVALILAAISAAYLRLDRLVTLRGMNGGSGGQ